jgi:hypothetical protein
VSLVGAGSLVLRARQPGSVTLMPVTVDRTVVVSPRALTVSGLAALDKTYDGTAVVSITGTPVLTGILAGDTVSLSSEPSGLFETALVGSAKTVFITGLALGGSAAERYVLTAPTGIKASVTPRVMSGSFPCKTSRGRLTISEISLTNRNEIAIAETRDSPIFTKVQRRSSK